MALESTFNLGEKTILPNHSSLKSKTVLALVSLQDWRRAEYDIPMDLEYDSKSCEEKIKEINVEMRILALSFYVIMFF